MVSLNGSMGQKLALDGQTQAGSGANNTGR